MRRFYDEGNSTILEMVQDPNGIYVSCDELIKEYNRKLIPKLRLYDFMVYGGAGLFLGGCTGSLIQHGSESYLSISALML